MGVSDSLLESCSIAYVIYCFKLGKNTDPYNVSGNYKLL